MHVGDSDDCEPLMAAETLAAEPLAAKILAML